MGNVENLCDKKGNCSNCGECCVDILPLNAQEINRIREYVRKHKIKEQRHLTEKTDLTCPFRSESECKCLIYPARPLICRTFKCNKSLDDITQERNQISVMRKPYSLRYTFFNNPESLAYLDGFTK